MSRVRNQPSADPSIRQQRLNGIRIVPLLLIALFAGMGGWAISQLLDPMVMPVRVVSVDGEIKYLNKQGLERTVVQAVSGNFFTVDLIRIRNQIEQLPWVKSASVRRIWPDTLAVRVDEQVPLAYWG
ncbi:MAG: cell division protein FtsQ/DivIB, partial [Candidatus Thiodiazotropha sp.]